jgi:hypothetical protein
MFVRQFKKDNGHVTCLLFSWSYIRLLSYTPHIHTHTSLPSHHDPLFQNANHTLLFCLAIFLLCANIWLNKIYEPGT